MTSAEEAAAHIREIVSQKSPVHGSEVAKALATRFSAWRVADMGVRNLREFISRFVPTVAIVGRSGMDVLYGLQGTTPSLPSPRTSSSAWRVWASPKSKSTLLVSKTTGTVAVVPRDSQDDPALLRFDPPGSDVHEAMAREFLTELRDPPRQALADALPRTAWWVEWARLLRSTPDEDSWLRLRRERLLAEFRERLAEAEFPETAAAAAVAALSQPHVPRQISKQFEETKSRRNEVAIPKDRELENLRRLVREVVSRMNEEDLRALKLPLGLVSDLLDDSRLKH